MTFKDVKKVLGLKNADIAEMFGYVDERSFNSSKKRKVVESGIVSLYLKFKEKG